MCNGNAGTDITCDTIFVDILTFCFGTVYRTHMITRVGGSAKDIGIVIV